MFLFFFSFSREDHLLICWYLESGNAHSAVIAEFPTDFFPTSMQWHPRPNHLITASKKQSLDILLITTADGMYFNFWKYQNQSYYTSFSNTLFYTGRFHLVNKNGRIEKSIEAHKGAVTIGKWSTDGSVLFTGNNTIYTKIIN